MGRKLIDTTNIEDSAYLLSQTPPNFVESNYYLKEMQDKVDADWRFRPNRKWIEQELDPGTEDYSPVEVVIQTVHGEKGEKVSDDWYKVVFRDCSQQNRLGKRYRFSNNFNPEELDSDKNVWIGLNQTTLSPTSAQVICRCNGSIGTIYTDEEGKNHIHYEPVIQPSKLSSANFQFSEVAIDPRSQIVLIAQHNKYTAQYYINERIVIGYDRVYKVTNIIKADSLTTYNPHDVGIIRIYLDQDQVGVLDDMENRIAYNGTKDVPVTPDVKDGYSLALEGIDNIPTYLDEDGIRFKPQVKLGDTLQSEVEVTVTTALVRGGEVVNPEPTGFYSLEKGEDGYYTLKRLKESVVLSLNVLCTARPADEDLTLGFNVILSDV